ncbi:MAG TPA: hypothetical protein VFL57_10090 [Bryobacteraceae bacterium]|nr:hypothetical protein [Bryobacteraceae bacterium]
MRDWVLYAMEFGDLSPPGAGDAILAVFRQFGRGFGYVLAALGVLGAALHLWRRRPNWREEHAAGIRTSAIATALAVLLFHGLVYRLVETRYLLAVAPAMLLLALSAFDVRWELRSTPGASGFRRAAQVAAGVILIVIQCAPTFGTPAKAGRDYVRITDAILANEQGGEQRLLVSSDASGEGAIVAEIAMRDARPRHVVARASKILARRKLMGNEYQLLYRNPEDVNDLLRAYGIQVVALDDCSRRNCGQHHDIVSRAVQNGERWRRAASVTLQSGGAARIYVARLESPETSRKPMRIDMHYTLKREIAVE